MGKTMALINNNKVENLEFCEDAAHDTDNLVATGDRNVHIGDEYRAGAFYRNGVKILSKDELLGEFERADITLAPPPKIGYLIRMNYVNGRIVFDYVEDPDYDGRGTYLKPILFVDGMEVVKDYFYTDTENIWEAISTGYPESFNDPNFFDIITV